MLKHLSSIFLYLEDFERLTFWYVIIITRLLEKMRFGGATEEFQVQPYIWERMVEEVTDLLKQS